MWPSYPYSSRLFHWHWGNRPISQIPESICAISHNATFCNRNVHISVTKWCIVGYVFDALWDGSIVWVSEGHRSNQRIFKMMSQVIMTLFCCRMIQITRWCMAYWYLKITDPFTSISDMISMPQDNMLFNHMMGVVIITLWPSIETALILGLCSANERRRYFVTTSLTGWVQA